jgi:hypothetical protein
MTHNEAPKAELGHDLEVDVRRPAAVLDSSAEAANALATGNVLAHAQPRGAARRSQH